MVIWLMVNLASLKVPCAENITLANELRKKRDQEERTEKNKPRYAPHAKRVANYRVENKGTQYVLHKACRVKVRVD